MRKTVISGWGISLGEREIVLRTNNQVIKITENGVLFLSADGIDTDGFNDFLWQLAEKVRGGVIIDVKDLGKPQQHNFLEFWLDNHIVCVFGENGITSVKFAGARETFAEIILEPKVIVVKTTKFPQLGWKLGTGITSSWQVDDYRWHLFKLLSPKIIEIAPQYRENNALIWIEEKQQLKFVNGYWLLECNPSGKPRLLTADALSNEWMLEKYLEYFGSLCLSGKHWIVDGTKGKEFIFERTNSPVQTGFISLKTIIPGLQKIKIEDRERYVEIEILPGIMMAKGPGQIHRFVYLLSAEDMGTINNFVSFMDLGVKAITI